MLCNNLVYNCIFQEIKSNFKSSFHVFYGFFFIWFFNWDNIWWDQTNSSYVSPVVSGDDSNVEDNLYMYS